MHGMSHKIGKSTRGWGKLEGKILEDKGAHPDVRHAHLYRRLRTPYKWHCQALTDDASLTTVTVLVSLMTVDHQLSLSVLLTLPLSNY